MIAVILLLCVVAAVGIYVLIRPLIVPLSSRVPTGREYRATLSHTGGHRVSQDRGLRR